MVGKKRKAAAGAAVHCRARGKDGCAGHATRTADHGNVAITALVRILRTAS